MDTDVTVARLRLFALAPREEQVTTIAALRAAEADVRNTMSLGFGGIAAAFLVALVVPSSPIRNEGMIHTVPEWIIVLSTSVVLALIVLAALAPAMVLSARDAVRQERAVIWLRAFEDELARCHRQRGRAARKWQRAH
ncbi:hypothetical protein [Microbacterium sulfonylureivorans]|uniref:hypothetical protein n=1 Tax=Microbacterium sulfonylureivorans TaxID=2486854 RepID=UPI000FD9457E|nr:hypothetical protein [Microbacterium sulfonylureivorans]